METSIVEYYDNIIHKTGDPRTQDLPFIGSLLPLTLLLTFYLLSVYILLPKFMKNRKPYALKNYIFYYNIFQILACSYLIQGISAQWINFSSWTCEPVDYSTTPESLQMMRLVYFTFLLKVIELTETFVFILRKKFNQVSTLHVYHHASTVFITWLGVKYIPGGSSTFPILINSFIHVLMYAYYLGTSLGGPWKEAITKWKSTLTMLQILQLIALLIQCGFVLQPTCNLPKKFLIPYLPNIALVLRMFWDFYKTNYLKRNQKQVHSN